VLNQLKCTLIGAAILVGLASVVAALVWAFTQIPNYPYAMALVIFIILSWVVGMYAKS
jgi:hypothetical protein